MFICICMLFLWFYYLDIYKIQQKIYLFMSKAGKGEGVWGLVMCVCEKENP